MAIYSQEQLNFILNEGKKKGDDADDLLSDVGKRFEDMGDDIKKVGKKAKDNLDKFGDDVKNTIKGDKRSNKKKKSTKKIKVEGYNLDDPDAEFSYTINENDEPTHSSLLEGSLLTKDGKTYKKLTKAELDSPLVKKNKAFVIDVDGEKYIQISDINGNPSGMGLAGAAGGALAGGMAGGAIGALGGAAAGGVIASTLGATTAATVASAVGGGLVGSGAGTLIGGAKGAKTGYKAGKAFADLDIDLKDLKRDRAKKEAYDFYSDCEHYSLSEFHQVDAEGYIILTEADKPKVLPNGVLKVGKKLATPIKKTEKEVLKFGDAVKFQGKKYKYQKDADTAKALKHPTGSVGQYVGSAIGAGAMSGGGPLGSAIGAAAGGAAGKILGDAIEDYTKDKQKASKIKAKKENFDFRNVYRSPEYSKAIHEYFDCEHEETRKILLAVNEEDQTRVLVSLTSKLYDNVVDKVDDIDFGSIPATKGDITKLPNYPQLMESIDVMTKILVEYKQDTAPVDTIRTAIANIIDSTSIWKRAFQLNVELPMVFYNTIVLSIIEATSYMISMCINYIKVPGTDTFQATIDKSALVKTKSHLVFDNLGKFNDAYRKGQVTQSMEYILKSNVKNFMGELGIGTAAAGIVLVLFCIVPIMRELIFLFYYNRVRVSEFFDMQADMLQINAYNVEHSRPDLTAEQRKSIAGKQMKVAERFRKMANKCAVQMKESEVKASKELAKENKKYKADEVMDEVPASASSALF